jgi:tetratricopeptide (TPR) repeat protein
VVLTLRQTRVVAFGALFFLLAMLPSLTVEVLGFSADRFAYLPAFGLSCAAAAGVGWLLATPFGRTGAARAALAVAAAGALASLALGSRAQCAVWRDSVSLWSKAVETYRTDPRIAHNLAYAHLYRGEAWERRKNGPAALADLDRAVGLAPGNPDMLAARGRVRAAAGDREGARDDYDAAITVDPRHPGARIGRGIMAAESGAFQEALADFTMALEADPGNVAANLNIGVLHLNRGEDAAALPFFTRAAEIDPGNAATFYGRARARSALGDRRGAAEDLERAVRLGYPDDPALRELIRQEGKGCER